MKKEMERTDLSEEEKLITQEKINHIVSDLTQLYPGMIRSEDVINGKLDDRLEKLEKITEAERRLEIAKLKAQNLESEKNFDKLNENYVNSKNDVSNLEKEQQKLDDLYYNIQNKYLDIEAINKEMEAIEKEGKNTAPNIAQYNQLEKQRRDLYNSIRSEMYENGFMQGAGKEGYYIDDMDSALKAIGVRSEKEVKKYAEAAEQNLKYEQEMRTSRDGLFKEIEFNYGGSLEEAITKYDQMDAAGKEVLKNALKMVADLNQKYNELPDKLFTEAIIKIVYDGVNPQEMIQKNLKYGPTGMGIGIAYDMLMKEKATKNAMGGFVNQAHLGIVGEAGPEAIIPLSGTNKHRGISLWQETGKMLGMLPKHANGGIFGGNVNYKELLERSRKNQNQEGFSKGITIHLGGMNFTFTGAGSADKEGILTVIRQQMPDIANEVAETIAKELQKLLLNMKTNIA